MKSKKVKTTKQKKYIRRNRASMDAKAIYNKTKRSQKKTKKPDPKASKKITQNGTLKAMFVMLQARECEDVIGWFAEHEGGPAYGFYINYEDGYFESQVLPTMFTGSLVSFKWMLNAYGFKNVVNEKEGETYFHPYFQPNLPEGIALITKADSPPSLVAVKPKRHPLRFLIHQSSDSSQSSQNSDCNSPSFNPFKISWAGRFFSSEYCTSESYQTDTEDNSFADEEAPDLPVTRQLHYGNDADSEFDTTDLEMSDNEFIDQLSRYYEETTTTSLS